MNVLVTGATGFVGREVVRQLRAAGHEVRILVRDPASSRAQILVREHQAVAIAGDVLNASSLRGVAEGVNAMIHLVGIISEYGENTYEQVHVNGTANILAAGREARVTHHLQMSALGSRPNAIARYHQTKWAAEEKVRQSRLPFTIFRPSIIYGPGDAFVNQFASIARVSPVMPLIGDGTNKLQPIAVEDVARAFVRALGEPQAIGQTYDLGGVDILTFEALIDVILEVLEKPRAKIHVPWALARGNAAFLEAIVPTLLHKAPPLNRDQLLMLEEDNVGDAAPARNLFQLPATSFREGIARYLKPS